MSWQAWSIAGCALTALAVMFAVIRGASGNRRAADFGVALAIFAAAAFVAAAVVAWPS